MKTKFILKNNWDILQEYDFIVPAIIGEVFHFKNFEYSISDQIIDHDNNCIIYLLKQ